MPRVFKLSMAGLKTLIAEEKATLMKEMGKVKAGFGPMGDAAKKAKETEEVGPDEHGTEKVHEKDINQLKVQKIKEANLLLQLKRLRESMRIQHGRVKSLPKAPRGK